MSDRRSWLVLAAVLAVSVLLVSTQARAGVPARGDRRLGISVGPAQDGNYPEAFAIAKSAGMQSVTLSLDWTSLEPSPGRYVDTYLDIANAFYPAAKTTVDIILRPINTNRTELPADLRGKAFDSPEVIDRFEQLVDHVLGRMPNVTIGTLAIGNEVDDSLGGDAAAWKQYGTFYAAIGAYVHRTRPGVPVGVVATFDGLVGGSRDFLRTLNGTSDVVMLTYYPLNAGFTVEKPTAPIADFARVAALYRGRPIVITEVGYPTSPVCSSSESAQAAFVHAVFTAWDAHPQIRAITFSWLGDLSPSAVAGLDRYYGVGAGPFGEFLRTLGLRTYPGAGRDKAGFRALKREAAARGWPTSG
jgi:hypothetical protein